MKHPLFPSLLLISALIAGPAMAQVRGSALGQMRGSAVTAPAPHIVNPGVSLSAPATSPLQAQEQDNYAAQLRAEQLQLQQQNPSGVTRPELGISRALNGFTPQ